MSSGAHEEYLDVDSNTDKLFMYYLRTRAFDLESMVNDYFTLWGITIPLYDDFNVFMTQYKNIYGGMISDPVSTTRLTEAEQKDFFNYVKYEQSGNYNGLTELTLDREDYGKNLIRNGAIHWNLFLQDYQDCDFQWLINGAAAIDGLTLENFYCPYEDDTAGITTAQTNFNTYLNSFVLNGDKKKKERVCFKTFLQKYVPIQHDTQKTTVQNDFYNDLISDTIHMHNKNNVISRLATTKRWKRRVLFKIPPYRTLPSHD